MQINQDGTGQRLFALDDCGDFVDVRVARNPNSYSTMVMDVDVALAAYKWLGTWLAAQGALTPARR